MLKKICQERPKDWDRYLSAVLLTYRDVPQSHHLSYGRTVRGPMQALKELWTETEVPETLNGMYEIYEKREDRICASVSVIKAENNDDTGVIDDENL
jgi:hypothetical protein